MIGLASMAEAITVTVAVGFHAFPDWVEGGFIGVDTFFVISGFLISTIIFDSLKRHTFSFAEFYSRRVKRIFPALLLVLSGSFAFGWFVLLADEYQQLGKHVAAGAGFIANFAIWNESGYFDNSSQTKPLLHLWSLGIEEQFYITWPFLLWAAWKWRFNLLLVTVALAIVSFALNIGESNWDTVATFYSPYTRFWEIAVGSCLAYVRVFRHSSLPQRRIVCEHLLSLIGATLVAVGLLLINTERTFPGWWALLPTIGTALVISAGSQAWVNRAVLSNRVLVWFGLISFPLYLWHWPFLSFAHIVESGIPSLWLRFCAVFVSIAFAWLTYTLVEQPIRFRRTGTLTTATLLLAMSCIGLAGYSSDLNGGYKSWRARATAAPETVKALDEAKAQEHPRYPLTEKVAEQFMGPAWKYTSNETCLSQYPFEEAKNYNYWFCMKSKETGPTLIILGNSFANQLYPGLAANNRLKHHSILSIGDCDSESVHEWDVKDEPLQNVCSGNRRLHQQQLIDKIIVESKTIKFAIFDGLGNTDPRYASRLRERIDFLEMNGIRVILFTPHFKPGYDPKACFGRPLKTVGKDCTVDVRQVEMIYEQFRPLIESISRTNPGVLFFDQNVAMCQARKCSIVQDGMPLRRDENHISEFGSIKLAKYFAEWAQQNIPEILDGP